MHSVWKEIRFLVYENELRFQREFDVFEFLLVWASKLLNRLQEQEETFIELGDSLWVL